MSGRGNVSNLIPFNKRTEEEQKKIAYLGGVMSGESRRKKRDLKQAMNQILYGKIKTPKELKQHIEKMSEYGFDAECAGDILAFTCLRKAITGDLKALEMVLNITGEGKIANNNVTVNVDNTENKLTLEDIHKMKAELLAKQGNNDKKRDRRKNKGT